MTAGERIFGRTLRQSVGLLVAALVPALLAAVLHPRRPAWSRAPAEAPRVTWSEVAAWPGPVLFVDARPPAAFARRHIPGALSLSEPQWETQLPGFIRAWEPGSRVVVYCDDRACDASESVARRLRRELGIDRVFVLQGGWSTWLAAQPR
jgi:rhodanese-related sulfurtransferase